jgi:5-methylcytosine-specific restriction endonuclease McrA
MRWSRKNWWKWYSGYLRSPPWQARRRRTIALAGGMCQHCGRRRAVQVHHLTYKRVGRERDRDLVALCWSCHQRAHDPIRKLGREVAIAAVLLVIAGLMFWTIS